MLGQGLEHNVYPSLNPDRVLKVGETKYVLKWVKDFKSRPDLFPIIYRVGKVQGYDNVTYVEMERLDTEQFEIDYEVLESILEEGMEWYVSEALKKAKYNKDTFNKIYSIVKNQDPEIAEFFVKLYDNVIETSKFKSGIFDVYDFHSGQFGYDKKGNIKMLDY